MSNVPSEILHQIGNKALVMMGAQGTAIKDGAALMIKIKGCRKISHIRFTVNDFDLYDIEFCKWKPRAMEMDTVKFVENVYNNNMHRVIEVTTGLYLSL